ncbi:HNH endonuclease signature motif containing protein [Paenibacillus sp. FSL H7-0357]|uniref:HNH endonuclease n=1 Tax=Paenibacillus sp. FSL H7-0357 TaxID=1536774 RepID=UPI000AB0A06C|nr:HNH endonuclease signature motif containing protein [Paenibacillus sp. FSL H7-0357]
MTLAKHHPHMPMTDTNQPLSKQCAYCHKLKPLAEFRRRTGKRSKGQARRGACRECRKAREEGSAPALLRGMGAVSVSAVSAQTSEPGPVPASRRSPAPSAPAPAASKPPVPKTHLHSLPERSKEGKAATLTSAVKGKTRPRGAEQRRKSPQPFGPKPDPQDASALIPSFKGMILMRGHSDKGRRWHQEIDLELAVTLVREHAAVVVNRRTIRRLYSNKDFRALILNRDNYTCHFCGLYGDTIDHLLPRAKGGHTTPDNCVCACNQCNQTKADQYVEEFMGR